MQILFTIELRETCDGDNKCLLTKYIVQQAALEAYARVALLDHGEAPQVALYSHDYENGRRDIPLEFAAEEHAEIDAISVRLKEALTDLRRPVLRVIEGGMSVPNKSG